MNPGPVLLAMAGHFVILVGFIWLMFRLGRFTPSARERRSWAILSAVVVAWVLLLAFVGPLPIPVVVAMNVVTVALFVWAWRSGRFSIERVPVDFRAEVSERRQWLRDHKGLLVGLAGVYMLANFIWLFAILFFALSQRA